jgi:alpha-mannosidase
MLPDTFSFVKVDKENIVIDTVKQAEDSDDIIVRLYDAYNCSGKVTLYFGLSVAQVQLCDLMENTIQDLDVLEEHMVSVEVKNFEIITLKVKMK